MGVLARRLHDARATALDAQRTIMGQRRKQADLAYWKYMRSSREHEINTLWAIAHELGVIDEVRERTNRMWADLG